MTAAPVISTSAVAPVLRLVRAATDALSYQEIIDRAQQAEVQGRRPEARELYEVALCRLRDANGGAEASNVLRWIARTHRADSDLDLALECANTALAVAEAHGAPGPAGHAHNLLAIIRTQQGDLDEAVRLYELARENAIRAGDVKLSAMIAQNLGVLANIRGDLDTALHQYETSLAAYRTLGMAGEVGWALNNIGLFYTQREQWANAVRSYEEALRIAELLGDLGTQMHVEINRAEWSIAQADYVLARSACERAMALAERIAEAPMLAEAHKAFGVVERELGDLPRAEHHLRRAHALATAQEDLLSIADTTKELGELHRRQGRNREALQCLNRSHRMYTQLRARRELADIDRRLGRLESDFLDVVRRWGESIECNDDYTQGHCERVADIACALAEHDGMDEQSLFWFRIGALLHDVGKLVIPPEVLNKRGQLSADEWALVRSHPTAGVEMLAEVEFPWDVSPIVEGHHERWDGDGYPRALSGEAIPRVARMVCIADVYDALTSERSYKKAMSHEAAMEVMRADVGRQFDPMLFAQFEQVAARRGKEWTAPARVVGRQQFAAPARSTASIDELTGLPLRGGFHEAARRAIADASLESELSLLVLDIDHFKLVNDTYGHLQGDAVLKGIARVLRDHAPAGACVARYAGDEFIVLLPNTGRREATAVAEQLRVAAHTVPVAQGRAVPVALTLSIGVASLPARGAAIDTLFATADAGLYEAKRRGRDTVAHVDASAEGVAPRPQLGTFVARGEERRRLVGLLQRASSGEPQIVSIVGEGGVGKSFLVRELGPEVRLLAGSFVAGRCADSEARAPYWPWAAVIGAIRSLRLVPDRPWTQLSRIVPPVGGTATAVGEGDRLAFFEEVSEFLRLACASRPFVVLLDDMQWADAASWDLLEYVVSHLERERLLVCLTVREEESGRDVVVRRTRMSRDERFHELRVARLSHEELTRWVEQAFQQEMPDAMLAHVFRHSEGNPFFTVQVLSAMLDERELHWTGDAWGWHARGSLQVPTPVKDLLRRRLARLSPAATRTLGAAAAIGRRIDLDLAIAAGIATEDELLDAIDEGIAARVLEPASQHGDEHATFSHGLLLDLLHEGVHPRRLRRMRERVAQAQSERSSGLLESRIVPRTAREGVREPTLGLVRGWRPAGPGQPGSRPA